MPIFSQHESYLSGTRSKLLCALCAAILAMGALSCHKPVKEPSFAGAFYPANPGELQGILNGFFDGASINKPADGRLVALISPHAGYMYSGHVAANAYKGINGYSTVVIIGVGHRVKFYGASVYTTGAFRTPLGAVNIDEELARALLSEEADVRFYPQAYENEHSIEAQIPFLQHELGDFRIVPVLLGNITGKTYIHLVETLQKLISGNPGVLLVASTDLSHYRDSLTAEAMDMRAVDAIERLSPEDVRELSRTGKAEMCGASAVMIILDLARRLGANEGVMYKYANSGQVTGDMSSVVGYAAMGLYDSPLTDNDRASIGRAARSAIVNAVRAGSSPPGEPELSPRLRGPGGAFVTIKRNRSLRGCMGQLRPEKNLMQSVLDSAVLAATKDPRFPPMGQDELGDMEIEVSVLSHMNPISPDYVQVGVHGVMLVGAGRSGIFLPQVAVEQGWDRIEYLNQLSLKAGLPVGSWRAPEAKLYGFTVEVIKDRGSQTSPEGTASPE